MNTTEQNQNDLAQERVHVLELLRSRVPADLRPESVPATAEEKASHENAEVAKPTGITNETEVRQG